MMPQVPEFSRPIEVARVGPQGSTESITADAKECVALAARLQLPAVHAVRARLHMKPWRGGGFKVKGEVKADITQVSVVSLEEFRSDVTFDVERYFLPHVNAESDEEIDAISDGIIDIGEVVAETMGIELDPYPRKPGESFQSGPDAEEERPTAKISPFAILKKNGDA